MDTNISALMARIQEIRTRMQEIQGTVAGRTEAGNSGEGSVRGDAVKGPGSPIPPGDTNIAGSGKTADFPLLIERALAELGREGSPGGAGEISGAVDLMSGALNSLTSLTDSGDDGESDILMSRENLTRLTDLERVLRGNLDDPTFGE